MSHSLLQFDLPAEAKPFTRKNMNRSERVLGPDHSFTFGLRQSYARALLHDPKASRAVHVEAETVLEDVLARARRVLGPSHPSTDDISDDLKYARAILGKFPGAS